jgi:hypothetical protein
MNQAEQAQKGFKTFILTLSISLIVFSAVYYFITNSSSISATPDIESDTQVTQAQEENKKAEAASPFGTLATQKITDVQPAAVLAATDTAMEPTQASGTPSGGVESITIGLIVSVAIFLFGMYVIANDPRRMAIKSFEDQFTNEI